jgi:hypothetical protein
VEGRTSSFLGSVLSKRSQASGAGDASGAGEASESLACLA